MNIELKRPLKIWLFLASILFCLKLQAQPYQSAIYTLAGKEVSQAVSESVSDMSYWLSRATGRSFEIKAGNAQNNDGIQLQWTDRSSLPASVKKQLMDDGQSFYLFVDGARSALIVGTGTNSFINGIYTFLHELGFRWYMPGDAWTVVPKLTISNLKIDKVYTPDFRNRSYFGTGGVNPIPGLDPQNSFKQDFATWNRRNRLSSDYVAKGHMGQAFYSANKKLLDSHPDFFCNNKVNQYGRIDIASKEAVAVFTSWALGQVNPSDRFPLIGVDPADGSGGKDDCLPATMPQIKTWSDKYFWLANQVAQKADAQAPAALVQLYAYASHAAPPNFALRENVYPVIIPYAFQDVAAPEQFIRLWQQKLNGRPMGIYDYWNITQWSSDVPQFNVYSIPDKLKLWKQNNVTTINLESTNAKGPMGHALWLATQMMWETGKPFEELYQEFLSNCFGPAASDLRRMYDRWSRNYQESMEWVFSLQDLNHAAAKTKDPAILQRINELKAYVHYLKLYYDYQDQPTVAGYNQLTQYIYSIHHLRLLQTSALQSRYINPPKTSKETKEKVAESVSAAAVKKLSADAIEDNFKKDLAVSPHTYGLSDFVFKENKTAVVKNNKFYNPLYINGENQYRFYLSRPKALILKAGATQPTQLLIKDSRDKVWLAKTIDGSKDGYETIHINLPAGGYSLDFGAYYLKSRVIFPEDIPFFSSTNLYDNYRYPLFYIYVPKDVTEIIYKDELRPGINKRGNWINPDGKTIEPQLLKYNIYRIPVPPGQRGKVWVLNIGHRSWELLNIPNVFSLNPFSYQE